MKQITLTDDNFKTLQEVVEFAIEDLNETQGGYPQGRLNPSSPTSATYADCENLQSAIEFCTKEVSP
jgi:hypothetical protein